MTHYFLLLLFFVTTFTANAQNKKHRLMGTWKLISTTMTSTDRTIREDSSTINSLKIISRNKFMQFTKKKNTDTLQRMIYGTLNVKGKSFTENIEDGLKQVPGRKFSFTYELDNNIWNYRGIIGKWTFDEVWVKID